MKVPERNGREQGKVTLKKNTKKPLKISTAYKTYYFSHLHAQINPKPDQKKKKSIT